MSLTKISILDLVIYSGGKTIADAFQSTRELARKAEDWGYTRYWMAEHHNLDGIGSAATPILIGHVASQTKKIRVGSGGIMLPNHSPMVVAEQFGTLETLYPGRIDLGLGRAPGTDRLTMQAIRGENAREQDFGDLIEQLLFYFMPAQPGQRIKAIPGAGINIPIWILGSSFYSAHLAARLGRPYSFAGHFAPQLMLEALEIYRREFRPSATLSKPYVLIGTPIVAADTDEEAEYLSTTILKRFLGIIRGARGGDSMPVKNMKDVWSSPEEEATVRTMLATMIVGGPDKLRKGIRSLLASTGADEIIITSDVYKSEDRLRSYEIIADVVQN